MDTPTSTLHTLTAEWAARGWPADVLDAFRMEGEGGVAAPAAPNLDAILDAGLANGGDDDTGDEGGQQAPAAPAAPTGQQAAPAGDEGDLSKFGEHGDYIKQLRQENAKYRTERNQLQERYATTFDGLADDDQGVILDFVRAYKEDPRAAVAWMRQNADYLEGVLGSDGAEQVAAAAGAGGADDLDRPMTVREFEQRRANEAKAAEQASAVAAINKEVSDLGVDPNSIDGKQIMFIAMEHTGGDIAKAHEYFTSRFKDAEAKAVKEFVDGKKADAEQSPSPVPQAGTAPAPAATPIKSVKEAGEAFDAYLDTLGYK